MKTTSLGLPLAVLLLGAGCGRTELDFEAEGNQGQAGSMVDSAGGSTSRKSGGTVGGSRALSSTSDTGGWAVAGAPPAQGGSRGGNTALPLAGTFAGNSATGGVRGGSTTSWGGFTATSGRGGVSGGFSAAAGRGGSGGSSAVAGRGGTSGGTLAVAGRGGSSGGTSGTSSTFSSSCPGPAYGEELIDDMNDGNRYIPTNNGRAGAWNVSHDASPDGTMFPASSSSFTMTETGDPCRRKAVYTYGSLFVEWGSNVWVSLGSPYNASRYRGVSFWARIDGSTSAGLRVSFPDKDTQPDGGLCQASVGSGPTACFDHYGKRINLTSEWTKYTVLFSDAVQERWGRQGSAFDPSTLYEILFQIPATAKFGLWIDDISFLLFPDLY